MLSQDDTTPGPHARVCAAHTEVVFFIEYGLGGKNPVWEMARTGTEVGYSDDELGSTVSVVPVVDCADARDAQSQASRFGPCALLQQGGNLFLQFLNPLGQVAHDRIELIAHAANDHRPVQQRMPLALCIGAHRDQRMARDESLAPIVVDMWWWLPGWRPALGRILRQHLGIQDVGLGATRQRLAVRVDLRRISGGGVGTA